MKMKKIIPILIIFLAISSFVFPPKAQAAWWNIFSWAKKENQKSNVVKIVTHSTTTPVNSSSSVASSLSSSSASSSLSPKKEAVKQETNINKESSTQYTDNQSAKIEKLKKQVEELKNKVNTAQKQQTSSISENNQPQSFIVPTNTALCNGKYWTQCPTGQKFYCPSVGDAQCVFEESGLKSVTENSILKIEKCKAKRDITRGILWPAFLETIRLAEQKKYESTLNALMAMVPPGTVTASDLANTAKISYAEHEKNLQTAEAMMEAQLAKEYAECLDGN